jgi:hypothetical protein
LALRAAPMAGTWGGLDPHQERLLELIMPESLLPSSTDVTDASPRALRDPIVAWHLHVRDISAAGLLPLASGACLRFYAPWSHECRQTSLTRAVGSHSWDGEHASLALPHEPGGRAPAAELRVELCAPARGTPEPEVLASATVTLRASTGRVNFLSLVATGPTLKGANASASFRFDIAGLTHSHAERAWAERVRSERVPPPSSSKQAAQPVPPARPVADEAPRANDHSPQTAVPRSDSSASAAGATAGEHPADEPSGGATNARHAPSSFAFGKSIPPPPASIRLRRGPPVPPVTLRVPPPAAHPVERASSSVLVRAQAAPSARLLMQLDECRRIKASFQRAGLPCPTAALERALLVPEDAPLDLCREVLPRPGGHHRPPPPPPVAAGKGKKGKGGKKKKK